MIRNKLHKRTWQETDLDLIIWPAYENIMHQQMYNNDSKKSYYRRQRLLESMGILFGCNPLDNNVPNDFQTMFLDDLVALIEESARRRDSKQNKNDVTRQILWQQFMEDFVEEFELSNQFYHARVKEALGVTA